MACQPELLMLSNSDARRLTDCYRHYLSFPNIVSISYCDEKKRGQKTGRKILCFDIVKKLECNGILGANLHLPKSVLFDTENKVKVEIPVQMVEEGEIVALNATYSFEGGKLVKKETNKKVSKYNSLNEVGQKPVDRICPGDKNNVAILHLFEKKANPGKSTPKINSKPSNYKDMLQNYFAFLGVAFVLFLLSYLFCSYSYNL